MSRATLLDAFSVASALLVGDPVLQSKGTPQQRREVVDAVKMIARRALDALIDAGEVSACRDADLWSVAGALGGTSAPDASAAASLADMMAWVASGGGVTDLPNMPLVADNLRWGLRLLFAALASIRPISGLSLTEMLTFETVDEPAPVEKTRLCVLQGGRR